jgi:[acyl-carrier-protein] S-malonyltransferase
MRTVFLFPGQGAQHVGMGRWLHRSSALARALFVAADETLGLPLTALCLEGPEEELRRTENAQPALFTVGVIAARVLEHQGLRLDAAAGHSVGEYAALASAGAMGFEDGLRVVRRRGEAMAAVAARIPGTMAAIVGLPRPAVEALCAAAGEVGPVDVASDNGPLQTVISGDPAAVERAMDLAEEHEGATAVPLAVAGAFHSRLMAPAVHELAAALAALPVRPPRIPVVANATAEVVRTPDEIRDVLVRQLTGSIRWADSLRRLAAAGARTLVDVGPGRTMARLARDVVPHLEVCCAAARPVAATAGAAASAPPPSGGGAPA